MGSAVCDIASYLPMVLPAGWNMVQGGRPGDDGAAYRRGQQTVIVSVAREQDGKLWKHVSTARPDRLPTWEELVEVKRIFIGDDLAAYQVIPAKSKHINIHRNCLHVFACLEGEALPDFTRGGRTL